MFLRNRVRFDETPVTSFLFPHKNSPRYKKQMIINGLRIKIMRTSESEKSISGGCFYEYSVFPIHISRGAYCDQLLSKWKRKID